MSSSLQPNTFDAPCADSPHVLNGRLAKGAKSPAGLAHSSRNAVKHGLSGGAFCLLNNEDPELFALQKAELFASLKPRDAIEVNFVTRIVEATWLLQRCQLLSARAFSDEIEVQRQENAETHPYLTETDLAMHAAETLHKRTRMPEVYERYRIAQERSLLRFHNALIKHRNTLGKETGNNAPRLPLALGDSPATMFLNRTIGAAKTQNCETTPPKSPEINEHRFAANNLRIPEFLISVPPSYNEEVPREYSLVPRPVPHVETKLRRIVTEIPAPGSIATIEKLRENEPVAMQGQPPVVWDHAENFQVSDKHGNTWIDWSSGVLITNAGHGRQEIVDAIVKQAQSKLLTNYCFPSEIRAELTQKLKDLLPEPLKKIFLLTTGSETVECAIKLSRAHAKKHYGAHKNVIVSYEKAFHGRTLGSQQAGGIPALKEWIGNLDPGFVQVPFPDGFRTPDTSFDYFLECLKERGVEPSQIAGVILETYQGGSASFAPVDYMQKMYSWTREHGILLTCDEVQAGFGRTGKLWGFEHYGIVPDLTTWGKGVSSSLPLAFVAGRPDVMDIFPAGSMTSTHTGNPVCCAAAIASIDLVIKENLVRNSAEMGALMLEKFKQLQAKYPEVIACVDGKGLVAGIACVKPGSKGPNGPDPDPDLAFEIVNKMMEKGVLLFSPVGFGGATIKVCPPLTITREAVEESTAVLAECFAEILQPVARV